jgi:TonB family protein
MNKFFIVVTIGLICCTAGYGQKPGQDTIRRFLTDRLELTSKSNAVFPALQIKSGDHWLLFAVYSDTGTLLKAYFQDKDLTIRDGPFALYHPHRIKAVEGPYKDNIKQGVWKYWHPNGQLKDSGAYKNNYYIGEWKSWDDSGRITEITHHPDSNVIQTTAMGYTTPRQRKSYLLAGDTIVSRLEGASIRYYTSGLPLDSGAYLFNQKHGLWKYWYKNGKLESTGIYLRNKQHAAWEYFREDGTRSTKETYVNNKVAALECYDEQGNASGSSCSILKPPVAQGQFLDFNKYALDNMFWPEGLKKDISGDVMVEYTITKEGTMKNLKILSSPHQLMSDEVIRFFKTLEHWSPAISHNRPVEYTVKYKVPFYR